MEEESYLKSLKEINFSWSTKLNKNIKVLVMNMVECVCGGGERKALSSKTHTTHTQKTLQEKINKLKFKLKVK